MNHPLKASLRQTFCFLSFLLLGFNSFSQVFRADGITISDFHEHFKIDSVPIRVSGLPSRIDSAFGLGKICIAIQHQRVSDLKIELLSPDGTAIWLTNRNGRDGADYFNTCFRSNGFNGYIHQAQAPFMGEYIPDGVMAFLNNGQNPNGTWYLLIQDLRSGITGQLDAASLEFSANPMPGLVTGNCSAQNPSGCVCGSNTAVTCPLLPDLIILPSFTNNQIKEYPPDHPVYPRQLRFAASIANIGNGPLELYGSHEWYCKKTRTDSATKCADGSRPRQQVIQRIYSKSGDSLTSATSKAGFNYYDDKPGHNHYHFDNWVEFRLVKKIAAKGKRPGSTIVIAKGRKVSFCLFDYGICNNADSLCAWNGKIYGEKNLENYGFGGYTDCKSGRQGISVGGYDTYGMLYEGQYLELPKGLTSGTYFLQFEIDPEHFIREAERKNNITEFPVTIQLQNSVKK